VGSEPVADKATAVSEANANADTEVSSASLDLDLIEQEIERIGRETDSAF
jgi:hypothetical protein